MLQNNLDLADRAEGPYSAGQRARGDHFLLLSQSTSVRLGADACVEVLECANRFLNETRFTWEHAGRLEALAGRGVQGMAGTGLVLIGGTERPWRIEAGALSLLKARLRTARHTCVVGAGVFLPLAAGALEGRTLSVHPNFRLAVREMTDTVDIADAATCHAEGLSSAIGGIAAASMMLNIVGQRVGTFTQQAVAEYLGLASPHQGTQSREHWRYVRQSRGNQVITDALSAMLGNLEEVLSTQAIAGAIGVSPRHLERCFRDHLGTSPMKVYRNLRLARARQMLVQTNLPISEISVASGFSSAATFAKWYRLKYCEQPAVSRQQAFCGA